jgi:hypothetical protein
MKERGFGLAELKEAADGSGLFLLTGAPGVPRSLGRVANRNGTLGSHSV